MILLILIISVWIAVHRMATVTVLAVASMGVHWHGLIAMGFIVVKGG